MSVGLDSTSQEGQLARLFEVFAELLGTTGIDEDGRRRIVLYVERERSLLRLAELQGMVGLIW